MIVITTNISTSVNAFCFLMLVSDVLLDSEVKDNVLERSRDWPDAQTLVLGAALPEF